MIERNLVDVLALLASIEARDETSALVDRIEARHVYFFTLECIEPPQINNECIEKALIQLTGAVMEVGYLLKCILVVLVFFGLAFLVKILVMYFHVPKNQ